MEGVERYKVKLVPHSNDWEKEYEETRNDIIKIWNNNILDIEHVGSTAINDICAKPILDIAIRLNSLENMDIEAMKKLGYDFCGAKNQTNTHYLFVLRGENQISLKHIHCYDKNEKEFFKLVKFRDYLNEHKDYAEQYAKLKESLAKKYKDNRIAYTAGKEEFIEMINEKGRLLLLYGVNCTDKVWDSLRPYLKKYEVDYVQYPHEITQKAKNVEDISRWVYENYHGQSYDAVIGHSLGGIIALQLASKYKMKFNKIIYLDTNLKPANEFYRNLMTDEHMNKFGKDILEMFKEERKFYTSSLFEVIQKEFDYTKYLKNITKKVYAIYGDRNKPDYKEKVTDLNLSN